MGQVDLLWAIGIGAAVCFAAMSATWAVCHSIRVEPKKTELDAARASLQSNEQALERVKDERDQAKADLQRLKDSHTHALLMKVNQLQSAESHAGIYIDYSVDSDLGSVANTLKEGVAKLS